MSLAQLIKSDSVLCNAHARSKKHCLEILSELLVRDIPDISAEDIFESLIGRERLGCTGLSNGVAFPHGRVEGLTTSHAALIKLSDAVDFDSADGEAVDLVLGLLVPKELKESDYADIDLITGLLSDPKLRKELRACNTSKELHKTLLLGCDSLEAEQQKAASAG
ncbi:MAG TPA: PTS sugar transporter subunit IIA [Woeseiaceae bacterium]|nr:PTS sugar transporter subunit IIA [Woeseiaceae bacterium]